jgi:hypothetical protein
MPYTPPSERNRGIGDVGRMGGGGRGGGFVLKEPGLAYHPLNAATLQQQLNELHQGSNSRSSHT